MFPSSSENSDTLVRFLNANPETYEQHLLAYWVKAPEFRGRLGQVLHIGPLGQPYEPFTSAQNNLAFQALDAIMTIGAEPTHTLAFSAYKMLADQGKLNLHDIPQHVEFLGRIMSIPLEEAKTYATVGLSHWLKEKWAKIVVTRARALGWAADQLTQTLSQNQALLDAIVAPEEQRSFAIDSLFTHGLVDVPRISSRLTDLNCQLGGGLGMGEATLIIGARGAGKTILAANLMYDAILYHKAKVVMISTEMRAQIIYLRMLADACSIPFSVLQNGIHNLDVKHRESVIEMMRALQDSVRIYMWPREENASGVSVLPNVLEQHCQELGGLHMVVLDWIGGALGAAEPDPAKVRMLMQIMADKLAWLASDKNICTITTAQAHVDRGLNKKWVDDTALAECKQLGRNMHNVIGITALYNELSDMVENGTKDKGRFKDEQGLCLAKSRSSIGGFAKVTRQFAFMRFNDRP